MRRRIEFFRKLTRLLFESLFVILLTFFFENVLQKQQPKLFCYIVIILLYIASFCVREVSKRHIFTFGWHIVFGIIVLKMHVELSIRIVLVLIVCHLMFSSIEYVSRGKKLKSLDDAPWPSFLMIFIMYLFGIYTGRDAFLKIALVIALFMLVTYYFMIYLDGLKIYIDSTKDVQGLPLGKVIARNNIIVFGIILILITCIAIGCALDYSQLLHWMKEIGKALLRLITSVFMIFSIVLNHLVSTNSSSLSSFTLEESEHLREYGKNVGNSFMIFLYIALVLLAIIIFIRVGKYVLKFIFAKNKHDKDVVEIAESRNDIRVDNGRKKGLFRKLTDEEKLRRKYRKHIEGYRYDVQLMGDRTCREIADDIKNKEVGDVSEITEVYVNVRYGNTKVDKIMLKKVNSLIRK